jgi:hypothetical protein
MPSKQKSATGGKGQRNTSQAKLKYINTCINTMINDLPRQTFSNIFPPSFEMQHTYPSISSSSSSSSSPQLDQPANKKRRGGCGSRVRTRLPSLVEGDVTVPNLSSTVPVIICDCLLSHIPRHPNIYLTCAFCQKKFSSYSLFHYVEQPHSRRRYTPLCDSCNSCNSRK